MKTFMTGLTLLFAVFPLLAQEKSPALKTENDKVSYSIGLQVGFQFARQNEAMKKQNVQLNTDVLLAGVRDAIAGKPQMTTEQVRDTLQTFEKDMTQKEQVAGEKNKADGEKYLADNKKKDGVKTTASGLQYKVIKEGSGAQPAAADSVTVNYRGTLIDGTEFDSSYKRNEPATFPLQRVIKGWTEGLQLMKKGAKYQFVIPSGLAYGEQGPPSIGSNATLIFEVELLDIKTAAAAAPSPSPSAAAK